MRNRIDEEEIGQERQRMTDSILKATAQKKDTKSKYRANYRKLYQMIKSDPNHAVYGTPPNLSYWQMNGFIASIGILGFTEIYLLATYLLDLNLVVEGTIVICIGLLA